MLTPVKQQRLQDLQEIAQLYSRYEVAVPDKVTAEIKELSMDAEWEGVLTTEVLDDMLFEDTPTAELTTHLLNIFHALLEKKKVAMALNLIINEEYKITSVQIAKFFNAVNNTALDEEEKQTLITLLCEQPFLNAAISELLRICITHNDQRLILLILGAMPTSALLAENLTAILHRVAEHPTICTPYIVNFLVEHLQSQQAPKCELSLSNIMDLLKVINYTNTRWCNHSTIEPISTALQRALANMLENLDEAPAQTFTDIKSILDYLYSFYNPFGYEKKLFIDIITTLQQKYAVDSDVLEELDLTSRYGASATYCTIRALQFCQRQTASLSDVSLRDLAVQGYQKLAEGVTQRFTLRD